MPGVQAALESFLYYILSGFSNYKEDGTADGRSLPRGIVDAGR